MKNQTLVIVPLMVAVSLMVGGAGGDGCTGPSPQEEAYVSQALPEGCKVSDLGSYGTIAHLVVVTCDGRKSQTSAFNLRVGKTYREYITAVVE